MLIRWATLEDKPSWIRLADNVANIFGNQFFVNTPSICDKSLYYNRFM